MSNDPKKYPPAISACTMFTDRTKESIPELTKCFVKQLHEEYYPNLNSNLQPFVKVIEVDTIFKTMYFDNKMIERAVTTLNIMDGGENSILVKLASQLSNVSGFMQSGSVIQLLSYQPVYFDPSKEPSHGKDVRVAVSLCNFKLVGTYPVVGEMKIAREKQMSVSYITSHEQFKPIKQRGGEISRSKQAMSEVICTKDN